MESSNEIIEWIHRMKSSNGIIEWNLQMKSSIRMESSNGISKWNIRMENISSILTSKLYGIDKKNTLHR